MRLRAEEVLSALMLVSSMLVGIVLVQHSQGQGLVLVHLLRA